jgi:hypothetical protein
VTDDHAAVPQLVSPTVAVGVLPAAAKFTPLIVTL